MEDESVLSKWHEKFRNLEIAFSKSGLPDGFFDREKPMTRDAVAAFQRRVGIPLNASLIGFLRTRSMSLNCDPIFPNLSKQSINVFTLGSSDGITFNEYYFGLKDFKEGVPPIIIHVLQIGELSRDQPLWMNLESGELLTGEVPAIVPCHRKNLDEHFKYYEQAVEGYDSINKPNHYTMPDY